jgi:hypothetical protein
MSSFRADERFVCLSKQHNIIFNMPELPENTNVSELLENTLLDVAGK